MTDMALQQVSLSGVIICPDQELEQRFAVNSFTVRLSHNYSGVDEWEQCGSIALETQVPVA